MTKSVALEMAPMGIRVNTIHPGLILTPMTVQEGAEDVINQLCKTIPMQRGAQPKEVTKFQ